MPKLRKLTGGSYLVSSTNGEKYGVLVDNTDRISLEDDPTIMGEEVNAFTLYQADGAVHFGALEELKVLDGLKVQIEDLKEEETSRSSADLDDYPVNSTDTIHEIEFDEVLKLPTFKKSSRNTVRYYPGWFIVKTGDGKYTSKLTISTKGYAERAEKNEVHGPYKTYLIMSSELKNLQK